MCVRHGRGAIDICLSEKGALATKRLGNTVLHHPGLPNLFSVAGHKRLSDVTITYCDVTNPLILISFTRQHKVIMSPIVARSVASLYGCKPNLKN